MEVRRPRITPKELVPFSRRSLYYQAPPILLPCPPHQISPLWKQNNRSAIKQMSRINHFSRIIKQSSPPCSWTKTSPSPWLQHLIRVPRAPHTYHKTTVTPLGHLHHKATAKSPTRHREHPVASAKPFPRANTGSSKTEGSLKADKQHLTLLLSSKHQPESPLLPDHQTVDSLDLCGHFPKTNRCCDQPAEKLPTFNQKPLIPPFPNYQTTEDPPCEDHGAEAEAIPSTFPDSQDPATPATTSPGHQDETSLKSRQSFVNLKHVIIIPSCDDQYYTWATAFESPSEVQHSKTSHPCLRHKETASQLRWASHQIPRFLGVTPSHLDQRTRATSAPGPKKQAENILAPTAQTSFPMEVECWEMTPSKTDHQAAVVTGQDHGATSPLVSDPQDKTLPGLDSLDTSQLNLNQEFEHWKVMPARTSHHAATQTGSDYGKVPPLDTEEKILPGLNHEATTHTSAHCQAKDISNLISQGEVDVSTQTEEYWETLSLKTDHQSTIQDQDHETMPLTSSVSQDTTLPGFHQAPYPPDCDYQLEAAPDPNTQASFPPGYIKLSGDPEHHVTPSLNTLPNHENQDPVLAEPAKKKWLHLILGKNHQQPYMKEMPRKRRRSTRGGTRGLKQRGN
ncbi:uncharacterized protein LOC118835858 isoform X2 [Trichosurus vulpecula]|uniref:uncharacterized protein LOC118835858 isoform X2 n=1 Tax=Trichosurus vulpecula TaxID=9337 RepID=UPI00186B4A09|nr:uncharacterized protein LOC118835858 isoform X2 [Trichosurus vulpecula]